MAQGNVVRAILFFSPSCGHCYQVINYELPKIFETYGGQPYIYYDQTLDEADLAFYLITNGQLEILLVDASHLEGAELYLASDESHNIPQEAGGVPRLIVGDMYLVGSLDIPQQFPIVIEAGLEGDGIDWPDIPGLQEALASIPLPEPTTAPTASTPESAQTHEPILTEPTPTASMPPADPKPTEAPLADIIPDQNTNFLDRFSTDPLGNSLSVMILIGMLAAVSAVFMGFGDSAEHTSTGLWIPILALIGILVAGYLAFVETTGSEAVCGPVGDCNTVQQSQYAILFGVLPVGLLGLISYLIILIGWVVARLEAGLFSRWAWVSIFVLSTVGTLFSIYLTFLEPFVIGATCAWCLASSVVITAICWLSQDSAKEAWVQLQSRAR